MPLDRIAGHLHQPDKFVACRTKQSYDFGLVSNVKSGFVTGRWTRQPGVGPKQGRRLSSRAAGLQVIPGQRKGFLVLLRMAHAAMNARGMHVQKSPVRLILPVRLRSMALAQGAAIEPVGLETFVEPVIM